MRVVLEMLSGSGAGRKAVLRSGQGLRVGRTEWADFVVPDDERISRVHFALEAGGSKCFVRDLDSTNGTLLNGQQIGTATVQDGDQITAGDSRFAIHIDGPKPAKHAGEPARPGHLPGQPSPVPPPAQRRIGYRVEQCDSGLSRLLGGNPDSAPADVARRLAADCPLYLIVHPSALNMPARDMQAKVDYLMPWLPEESAAKYSPVILASEDSPGLIKLIESGWDKNAVIAVFSESDRPEVLAHLHGFAAAFARPGILAPQLKLGKPAFVQKMMTRIEAVLLEGDSPNQWVLFPSSEFEEGLSRRGLLPQTAAASPASFPPNQAG